MQRIKLAMNESSIKSSKLFWILLQCERESGINLQYLLYKTRRASLSNCLPEVKNTLLLCPHSPKPFLEKVVRRSTDEKDPLFRMQTATRVRCLPHTGCDEGDWMISLFSLAR